MKFSGLGMGSFLLAGIALLSGCGLDNAVSSMNMVQFRKQCSGFGFQPGTDAFAKCLMQQSAQREQFNQHIVDQDNRQNAIDQLKGK